MPKWKWEALSLTQVVQYFPSRRTEAPTSLVGRQILTNMLQRGLPESASGYISREPWKGHLPHEDIATASQHPANYIK